MEKTNAIGDWIETEGQEEVHRCNACGGNRMLVNPTKQMFHCWNPECNVGGVLSGYTTNHEAVIHSKHTWKDFDTLFSKSFALHGTFEVERILRSRGITSVLDDSSARENIFPQSQGIGICLRNPISGVVCGIHTYYPKDKNRYVTQGKRGIASLGWKSWAAEAFVVLEGMFDWLSLACCLPESLTKPLKITYIFTPGSSSGPKSPLAEWLVYLSRADENNKIARPIFIGFDNDKPAAAAALWERLRGWRDCRIAMPPKEWGKDWDEAIQVKTGPEKVEAWWRKTLGK